MRFEKWTLPVFLLIVACCWAASSQAAAPPLLEVQGYQIGFAGCFQVGMWTPATATVVATEATSARLVVVAPDADGQMVRSPGPIVKLDSGKPVVLRSRFCSGRQSGEITLRVEAEDFSTERKFKPVGGDLDDGSATIEPGNSTAGLSHQLQAGFRQDVPFWGICGIGDEIFAALKPKAGSTSNPQASESDEVRPEELPQILKFNVSEISPEAADLAALDLMVLAAGAPVASEGQPNQPLFMQISEEQAKSLRDWVQVRGGHLVIALGSHLKAFQASHLGKWLALPLEGEGEVRQLNGIEAFSMAPEPLKVTTPVPILQMAPKNQSQILARSLGVPLLVQMPSGFGRVSFLAVDLDKPPLSTWVGTSLMVRRLQRGDRGDTSRETRTQSTQLAKSAITDLSSQLYAAEETFPGVYRFSLWGVMLLLGAYILVIGPLDYLLVHRWLKRPDLTWFTFPLWVFGGAIFAVILANSMNGRTLQTRQLEVVDVETTSGVIRGRSWITLYSPQTSRRSIEFETQPAELFRDQKKAPFQSDMTWLAMAENRVGGLYREGGVQLTQRQYQRTNDGLGLADFPLQVWSTGRFGGEWSGEATQIVESKLTSSGFGQLKGSVSHRLPVLLEDCLLAYGNRVYFPVVVLDRKKTSHLRQFFTWEIGGYQPFEQRELRGYLTEIYTKQIKKDNSKTGPEVLDVSKPYDPARRDFPYILRMISFHMAAGGQDYTQLRNDVLENMDLSQQLRMGRAVLIGRIRQSSARWKIDGQDRTDAEPLTYLRVVLPVAKEATSGYRQLEKPNEGL